MVNDEGVPQLSDFGLSKMGLTREVHSASMGSAPKIYSESDSATVSGGNPRWLAPELLFPSLFPRCASGKSTRESDIYAFGMTALEVRVLLS